MASALKNKQTNKCNVKRITFIAEHRDMQQLQMLNYCLSAVTQQKLLQ